LQNFIINAAFQNSALDGGSISAFSKGCIFVMLELFNKMAIRVTANGMTFHMFYVGMCKFVETLRRFSDM
jgi:hypothetical protein